MPDSHLFAGLGFIREAPARKLPSRPPTRPSARPPAWLPARPRACPPMNFQQSAWLPARVPVRLWVAFTFANLRDMTSKYRKQTKCRGTSFGTWSSVFCLLWLLLSSKFVVAVVAVVGVVDAVVVVCLRVFVFSFVCVPNHYRCFVSLCVVVSACCCHTCCCYRCFCCCCCCCCVGVCMRVWCLCACVCACVCGVVWCVCVCVCVWRACVCVCAHMCMFVCGFVCVLVVCVWRCAVAFVVCRLLDTCVCFSYVSSLSFLCARCLLCCCFRFTQLFVSRVQIVAHVGRVVQCVCFCTQDGSKSCFWI